MKRNSIFPFVIIAIVLASCACLDTDLFKNQIKGLSIVEQTKKETADVIVVEDIKTLPVSPVFSGQAFRLFFTLKNVDTERTVNNVHIELYDHSIFKSSNNFLSSECSGECSLPPLGEKVVFFDLIAPSAEEIVFIQSEKRISFKVSYDYETTTLYDVVVVNKDEIEKQQQAGKTVSISPNRIMGSGPIKIIPDLMGEYVLLNGVTGTVRLVLQNQGGGMLENNEISSGNLRVEFPSSFSPTGYAIGSSIFDKISVATGNIILIPKLISKVNFNPPITGMAITDISCDDRCRDYYGAFYVSSECDDNYKIDRTTYCYNSESEVNIDDMLESSCTKTCVCKHRTECGSLWKCDYFIGRCVESNPTTTLPNFEGTCNTDSDCFVTQNILHPKCWNNKCIERCGEPQCGLVIKDNCLPDETCEAGNGYVCQKNPICTQTSTTYIPSTTIIPSTTRPPVITTTTVPIWNRVTPTQFFSCSGNSCTNTVAISLFQNSESSPLTFGLTGSTETDVYKVYTIRAVATYRYELRKYIDVTIKPMGIEGSAQP